MASSTDVFLSSRSHTMGWLTLWTALALMPLGCVGSSGNAGGGGYGYVPAPTVDGGTATDGGGGTDGGVAMDSQSTSPDTSGGQATSTDTTQSSCTPTCGGAECGPNGCGGSCGTCPAAAPICTSSGVCKAKCVPQCAGKQCGSDGCGGTCGTCAGGSLCNGATCMAATKPCDVTSYQGCCQGATLLYCTNGKGDTSDCASTGKVCGWNAGEGYYDCVSPPAGADPSGTHPVACGTPGGAGTPLAQLSAVKTSIVDQGGFFPTWLAHLYGSKVGSLGELHFLSVTIDNPGTVETAVKVTGELAGYSKAAVKLVKVPAKGSKTVLLDPTWSPQLYKLSSAVPGKATVALEVNGKLVDTGEVQLKVLPVDTVLWSGKTIGGKPFDSFHSVVTLITPNDKWLQTVLTKAAKQSIFGSMTGYQYSYGSKVYGKNLPSVTALLPGGTSRRWIAYYEAGQVINLDVSVTCSVCWSYNAGYGLVPMEEYKAYMAGTGGKPLVESTALGKLQKKVLISKAGYYVHVAWNPSSNSTSRHFTIGREMSIYEGAADQLSAIYDALVSYNLVYVNVPGSYFSGAQNIKTVTETLLSGSANCIDGSIVFAAALEALGMDAALVSPPGHALVAVKCWGTSKGCIVPLETTSMGNQVSAEKAITSGWGQLPSVIEVADVSKLRKSGWLPAPL
ncbi:MAG: hypothetical protein KC502_08965 [Myxococcales bacterium]|nr:hypothetical protein [Myxococcales bacterium]